MAKRKKKKFANVEEVFETYIPGYVKPIVRNSNEGEDEAGGDIDTDFTGGLLEEFKQSIS
ncbi:MAG: hypothetical protein ACYTE5_11570 [Planctomycetota bacterium]|jgi:hypothetical protein